MSSKKVIFNSVILTFTGIQLLYAQTTLQEIKTDKLAQKVIRLINTQQPDTVYALAGDAFKQQISAAQWEQIYQTQINALTPFKAPVFTGSVGLVNTYKLEGKVTLTLNIGLDQNDKIADFSFVPYQEEVKQASMTEAEKRTDIVAQKVLGFINTKQADSSYALSGEKFRQAMSLEAWRAFNQKQLNSILPLPKAIFMNSQNGVSKYKLNQLQFLINLDTAGKFEVLAFQPYSEQARKSEKAATDNSMRSPLDTLVNKWLSGYIQTKGNVGISAAVYYKGADHYYNYGETAKGNHKLPDAHTLYEIGSITKTFTATLLARAVTNGLVKLDDPIIKFLPDSVAANADLKGITLKTLSNHTSGLPRMPSNFDATVTDLTQPYEHYDEAHMFAFLKGFKAVRAPGASYEYSNLAVGLLGVILEKVYHKPYEELVKLYITQPLQLTETKITLTELDVKHLAQGYDANGNTAAPWRQLSTKAAGAIKSSAANMLQYGKQQLPKFNNPLSKVFKLTQVSTFDDGANNVALGWHFLPNDKDAVIQHSGGTGGYRTAIAVNFNRDIVVVVLTNNATNGDNLGLQLMVALENGLSK